jgi:hypothetical protein
MNKLAAKDPPPHYAPPELPLTTRQLSELLFQVDKCIDDISRSRFYEQTTFVFCSHTPPTKLVEVLTTKLGEVAGPKVAQMIKKTTTAKIILETKDVGVNYGQGWEHIVRLLIRQLPGLKELVLVPYLFRCQYEDLTEILGGQNEEEGPEGQSRSKVTIRAARAKCFRILKSVAEYETETCSNLANGTAYQSLYQDHPDTMADMACEFSLRKGGTERWAGEGLWSLNFTKAMADLVRLSVLPLHSCLFLCLSHHGSLSRRCIIVTPFEGNPPK